MASGVCYYMNTNMAIFKRYVQLGFVEYMLPRWPLWMTLFSVWHLHRSIERARAELLQVQCWILTSSNGKKKSALLALCARNSPVTGEFPAQRPETRSCDVFIDLQLNKRRSKQSWGWWFETPSCSLWRHCNGQNSCPVYMWGWYLMGEWYHAALKS